MPAAPSVVMAAGGVGPRPVIHHGHVMMALVALVLLVGGMLSDIMGLFMVLHGQRSSRYLGLG